MSGPRLYLGLGAAALVIAALSLLIPSTPSYDPWAWLVWGHEIVHLDLHTTGGPSWKPLPMLFTTVFALFGKAQPDLWLIVARAGAVMAVAMVFKLAWRLTRDLVAGTVEPTGSSRWLGVVAPLLAGVIAAGSLVNSGGFISDNALGYSEGLATALALIAVDSYMDGARQRAFIFGFFAALDRPELWFFWGPYGLYLFWRDPGARKLVVGLFALIPVLWFLPELWGSGHLLRGVTRAEHPRSNSAAFAKCPVCTVFKKEAWPTVLNRVKIPGLIALFVAAFGLWRTRASWWRHGGAVDPAIRARAWLLGLGLFGLVWWFGISLETQAGFSGNNRYLVLGSALVEICGAVAWGWAAQEIGNLAGRLFSRGRQATAAVTRTGAWSALVAVALVFVMVPSWIGNNFISIPRTHGSLVYQAHLRQGLNELVAASGGADKIVRCGSVMTEGFQVPMVAWALGVHTLQIQAPPPAGEPPGPAPNVILQTRDTRSASLLPLVQWWPHVHYKYVGSRGPFNLFTHCAG